MTKNGKWIEELKKQQNKSNQNDHWLIWKIPKIVKFLTTLARWKRLLILNNAIKWVDHFNPLSADFTKWSNTLKQFVGKCHYDLRFTSHVKKLKYQFFCCFIKYKYEKDLNLDAGFMFIFRWVCIYILNIVYAGTINW